MSRLTLSTRLTFAYLGLAAADSWLAGSSRPLAATSRRLTKPLLMPTLAASLATDRRAMGSPLRSSTLVAQACGWGGDLMLLRHGTAAFAAGAGSFGVGHDAYVTGFRRHRDRGTRLRDTTTAKVAAGLVALGGPTMAIGAFNQEKALGPAVLGYTALLAGMLAHAGHLDPTLPARSRRLTLAGAALFVGSDTVLGAGRFLVKNPPPRLESVVMATYTAGQLLLSKGAALAG
ncbi:lysoplasmalogenase [Nocardioides terrisoli]|uniref:lysoplasmalogenase n=1 Tax=Nocardioides terrisoli TaxID=3388267 RepID=UPI00287B9F3E|nr:lysoplasmalogenase [Nocardioides marmorisolisilvae]